MIRNYLKVAVRNIVRHKAFSIINVTGLAVGIACSVLILLFVSHELNYDRFHEKAGRIHRIAVRASIGNTQIRQTSSSAETFRKLLLDFPEIEAGVKFLRLGDVPVMAGDRTFSVSRMYAVDKTFYEIFTVPLIKGNPKSVLANPNTMVLSKESALKYFGTTEAVGRVLRVHFPWAGSIRDFEITGVSENMPDNSHFHYDILVSLASFPDFVNDSGWSANNFITYLLLKKGALAEAFNEKLQDFTRKYMGGKRFDAWVAKGNSWEYYLQPLTAIHLTSDLNGEFEANGNRTYVLVFSLVSIIILLIACINFMNLSTAKSSLRAREVGLRKVVGSGRRQLVIQFLSESVMLSFIALALGMGLVHLLLPSFRSLVDRPLHLDYAGNPLLIPLLLALGLLVGVLSGSYPAFYLSAIKPVAALKNRGIREAGRGGAWLRNVLVVFQFSISIFLMIGTLVVFEQLKFFQNKKLGFEKNQVLVIRNADALGKGGERFKQSLKTNSRVLAVSGASNLPGMGFSNIGFGAEGVDENFTLNLCVCDRDFLRTLGLEMAQGRFFSREFPSDSHAVILNEKAARLLNWDDAVGRKINNWSKERGDFTVIGVVRDFHYESLHHEIRPMALFLSGGYYNRPEQVIAVKLQAGGLPRTLRAVEAAWKKFAPAQSFDYSFLDRDFDKLYINEKQTRKMFTVFSLLALFIACLGLFGLASFMVDQKTKEIGIRKVLGASVSGLVARLDGSFLKWILAANLLAWPVAWTVMGQWLQNFAYRIALGWWMFLLAAALAVFIALVTVSFQTVRASLKNPVDSLRFE